MRTLLFGVAVGLTMAVSATNAFAQTDGARAGRKTYGTFRVGATNGGTDSALWNLTLGADFAQAVNRRVEIYLAGGWQEDAPAGFRDPVHFTSGVKLMLSETFIRPYVRLGVGVMHLPGLEPIDGTDAVSLNKFLGEVGGGMAIPVGTHGYIDVGYRYLKPRHLPDFTPHGIVAGFGYRY